MKYLYCICLLAFCVPAVAHAQSKSKKKQVYFTLLEAFTQRTLAGIPGSSPATQTHFIIVWAGSKYPETFFWRGENGWLTCSIAKAHKVPKGKLNMPAGMEYTTERISGGKVTMGDTLQLTPIPGGKFAVPKEIPVDARNTLFYKAGGSKWLSYPVKEITRKQDIAMP